MNEVHNYNKDGPMRYRHNGNQPVYAPNSYGGPRADAQRYRDSSLFVEAAEIMRTAYVAHKDDNMAQDFRPHGVAVISVWPGPTATERARTVVSEMPNGEKILGSSETPQFSGLVIASLYADSQLMSKSET
jgi:NAD(P)-dependent dehydrogenase (short-subunit alcohol dehydrogenase family)